jgi:hypothetical protein
MNAQGQNYHDTYRAWQDDPLAFWAHAAQSIDWMEPFERVFDPSPAFMAAGFPVGCATPPTTASTAMWSADARAGGADL